MFSSKANSILQELIDSYKVLDSGGEYGKKWHDAGTQAMLKARVVV